MRQELSSRHDEDSRAALLKLADLKEKAMEQARDKWKATKRQLLEKVTTKLSSLKLKKKTISFYSDIEFGESIHGNARI